MRILRKAVAAVLLLLFFLLTPQSTAEIISVKIQSDYRHMILFSNFEFSQTGHLSVAVSSINPVTSNSSKPDPSRIGFLLLSNDMSLRYDLEFKRNFDLCPLDNKSIPLLFTFSDLSPPPHSSFNKSYTVTHPGDYSLYFVNCNDLSVVTMDVRAELYNIDADGVTKDYLSAGEPDSRFYVNLLFIYLCAQWIWIAVCVTNRHYIQPIHIPMSALLVTNLVYFICAAAYQHDLMVTGTQHGWHIFFYFFRLVREAHFSAVILFIGAGWCNWRRNLPDWVKINLGLVVYMLQSVANYCFMDMKESGPYNDNWLESGSAFTIADFLCCLVVVLHVIGSGIWFKEATDTSDFVRSYSSLKGVTVRHQVFPFLVIAYVFFTRGLSVVLETSAFHEVCTLVLTMAMLYMYRPYDLDADDEKRAGFLDHFGV